MAWKQIFTSPAYFCACTRGNVVRQQAHWLCAEAGPLWCVGFCSPACMHALQVSLKYSASVCPDSHAHACEHMLASIRIHQLDRRRAPGAGVYQAPVLLAASSIRKSQGYGAALLTSPTHLLLCACTQPQGEHASVGAQVRPCAPVTRTAT